MLSSTLPTIKYLGLNIFIIILPEVKLKLRFFRDNPRRKKGAFYFVSCLRPVISLFNSCSVTVSVKFGKPENKLDT